MSKNTLILSAITMLVVAGAIPAGTAGTPLIDLSLGFPLDANFNEDDGGWTANVPPMPERLPPASSWAWGTPTSGPGKAASGNNVWATNLAGNYNANECGAILSPPIDLTGVTAASVSFSYWLHSEQTTASSKNIFDAGLLFVTPDGGAALTIVPPAQGYNGPIGSGTTRACLGGQPTGTQGIGGPAGTTVPAATYKTMSADLSAFAGQTVQFAIAFGSDGSAQRAGWYIDNFTVTKDGVSVMEDFEASDGGFTVIGTAGPSQGPLGWSWGVPTYGPAWDSALWATNPTGDYGHKECSFVESPAFTLGDLPSETAGIVNASLTWNNWYRANSLYAAGIVQVGVVGEEGITYHRLVPDGGYPSKVSGTYTGQLVACLGEDATTGAFMGFHDSLNTPLKAYRADLTPYVGQEITVRFLFASAWSTSNPTLSPGWYVDDVAAETFVYAEAPDVEPVVNEFVDNLPLTGKSQAPGWTSGGVDSSWEYGFRATEAGDELVYATNLTGNHGDEECSWIESPAIPGAALALNPTMRFEHQFDIYSSSLKTYGWNGGVVLVSTDDGATWSYLNLPDYDLPARFDLVDCIQSVAPDAPASPGVFTGLQEEYEGVTVDLSAYTSATTVKVRFLLGSGISLDRDGWNIRHVEIGGADVL